MNRPCRLLLVGAPLLAAVSLLPACTSKSDVTVKVVGTDDACTPDTTQLKAGKVTFEFTNRAGKVSELYVLRQDESIVSEVENVTSGTKRTLTANLSAGEYVLVCKPGQTGDGFRSEIQVTGEGGPAALVPDRTVRLTATDYAFTVPDGLSVRQGEVIRFEMENAATDMAHEMEVFDPRGVAIGEIGPTAPGATGTVTLKFEVAGTYRLVCGIEGHEAKGMVADLVVTPA